MLHEDENLLHVNVNLLHEDEEVVLLEMNPIYNSEEIQQNSCDTEIIVCKDLEENVNDDEPEVTIHFDFLNKLYTLQNNKECIASSLTDDPVSSDVNTNIHIADIGDSEQNSSINVGITDAATKTSSLTTDIDSSFENKEVTSTVSASKSPTISCTNISSSYPEIDDNDDHELVGTTVVSKAQSVNDVCDTEADKSQTEFDAFSIEACLQLFSSPELLEGDEKVFCEVCSQASKNLNCTVKFDFM